ncbi:MAG: enoyl-CoA hydratase-related protein [Pseudomonadales bacterium]|jgi:enoyl-CoA hydratase/carnithine racemase|nr:enoyl-CoA hydratase-related protein [Pseudomonadales bacterium]MDP6471154.1 enoyl-CoA hydratase-related protein [Pseudomonadales bacterium]MDP6825659.1 enoyl-CoA hydratase-related protein [Pseudomonadales bacterium]MDP6971628.1 enoyl-CoA hydratase-related protein [Pseudomonadales bacterium]|tara:strand:+ start:1932 stop:2741 length:810 start_codon:yes stop_codon:yes gene_type:complete
MTDYSDIEVEIDDPVAIIRLNRPERLNAFTYHTLREIRGAVDSAASDRRVVGIIITGNGRGFSAGLDADVLAKLTGEQSEAASTPPDSEEWPGIFSYLVRVPKPVISAVNGVTAGGGLILALMSDLRIVSSEASFTTIFLKRGLISEHGSSWLLPRLVGLSRALDLLWMSDRIDADEALRMGLVDRVVAPERLLETAREYIQRLAETSPPAAIAETKRLVYRHLGSQLEEALREAEVSQNRFVAAPDAREGAAAFLEKRPPVFSRLGDQ